MIPVTSMLREWSPVLASPDIVVYQSAIDLDIFSKNPVSQEPRCGGELSLEVVAKMVRGA